jgi:hypothetical protein
MKKIYIIMAIIAQAGLAFSQVNPGHFQYRLVNPGGEPGVMRVQARAIIAPVPTTNDFVYDIGFGIWWDPVADPTIIDIDVVSSIENSLSEANPVDGNSSGSGAPNGKVVYVSIVNPFIIPVDWTLNQWVNIATLNICANANCNPPGAPAGKNASDFLIQGFTGIQPVFTLDVGSGGEPVEYTPGNAPLPLNLIAFQASKSGERDAQLTWSTANEENTSHFIVQRSFDKTNWTEIGTVPAAGYSTIIRNYDLTDIDVNDGRTSRVRPYYRLVMVDRDGRSSTSPIESLIFTNSTLTQANNFELFPNPASDGVYVTWDEENTDQPTLLEFYDIAGKLIYRQNVSDKSTQEYIDFGPARMQSGVYMLRIMNGAETLDHKQIVVSQRK